MTLAVDSIMDDVTATMAHYYNYCIAGKRLQLEFYLLLTKVVNIGDDSFIARTAVTVKMTFYVK